MRELLIQKPLMQLELNDWNENFRGETMEIVDYNLIYDRDEIKNAFIFDENSTDEISDLEMFRTIFFDLFDENHDIKYGIEDVPIFIGGTEYKLITSYFKVPPISENPYNSAQALVQQFDEKHPDVLENNLPVSLHKLEYDESSSVAKLSYII